MKVLGVVHRPGFSIFAIKMSLLLMNIIIHVGHPVS